MIHGTTQRRKRCRVPALLAVVGTTAALWNVVGPLERAWTVPLNSGLPRLSTLSGIARVPQTARAAAFHDQAPAKDVTGSDFSFDQLKGKVVYAVNVASRWGATKREYAEFAMLAEKDGLELLLFPCGQFGGQELDTDADIKAFVEKQGLLGKSNVHVMSKGDVTGNNMNPTWKIMKDESGAPDPGWNFAGKFVIGKDGDIKSVAPGTSAVDLIEEALAA